jgi:lipoprotein-anchoring transpeptidase ErfK/SrfK
MKNIVSLAFSGLLLLAGCASQPYPPLPSEIPTYRDDLRSNVSEPASVENNAELATVDAAVGGGLAPGAMEGHRASEHATGSEASLAAPVSQEVNPPPPDPATLSGAEKRQLDIRLAQQRFNYFEDDQLIWTGPISSGTPEHPTPRGKYLVQSKNINKRSGSYTNFFDRPTPMPYSLQFTGPYFVHEGYVTGRPESHGCVRLRHEDAKFVYARMRIGDRIVVAD